MKMQLCRLAYALLKFSFSYLTTFQLLLYFCHSGELANYCVPISFKGGANEWALIVDLLIKFVIPCNFYKARHIVSGEICVSFKLLHGRMNCWVRVVAASTDIYLLDVDQK